MKVTNLYQSELTPSWSMKVYTEQLLEEVNLDIAQMSDEEDGTFSFGILDGASRDNSYMQAVDKFRISEYSNSELASRWLSLVGNEVLFESHHKSIESLQENLMTQYLYADNISNEL